MKRMSLRELQQKDVINLCNGTRIGNVCELEFDQCTGQICTIVVSRGGSICGFGKEHPIALPWCKIDCIGEDTILIKVPQEELDRLCSVKKRIL